MSTSMMHEYKYEYEHKHEPPPPQIMSGLKAPGPALTVVAVKRSVFYSPSPSVYLTDREMV